MRCQSNRKCYLGFAILPDPQNRYTPPERPFLRALGFTLTNGPENQANSLRAHACARSIYFVRAAEMVLLTSASLPGLTQHQWLRFASFSFQARSIGM